MQITGLYNTFGEMTEWFMINNENKPAFTFELRPHMGDSPPYDLSSEQITDTVKENIPAAFYFISTIIEGNTQINMDIDENGVADIIQDTSYEYECSREESGDTDSEITDSDDYADKNDDESLTDDTQEPEITDTENENPGNRANDSDQEKSGCSLTMI
jgi:hypothetical protein